MEVVSARVRARNEFEVVDRKEGTVRELDNGSDIEEGVT